MSFRSLSQRRCFSCVTKSLSVQVKPPPLSTFTSTPQATPSSKWTQYYYKRFRDAPGSYLVSFGLLHEITAIVPLPLFYYALQYSQVDLPALPQVYLDTGKEFVEKLQRRYPQWFQNTGATDLAPSESTQHTTTNNTDTPSNTTTAATTATTTTTTITSQKILHMTTSYALVKLLLPVRLASSAALTPWFAQRVIQPMSRWFRSSSSSSK